MICAKCKLAAAINRRIVDGEYKLDKAEHPKTCGCPCMHRMGSWGKLFSVGRPNEEASTAQD